MAVGGPDVLVLDAKNVLWRWRPADKKGKGTLTRVKVSGATSWGADVRGIGTFIRKADAGLYNLYVVDPSSRQVLRYSPAADGSGYPAAATDYLATAQSVDEVTSLSIDGDVFLVDAGRIERFVGGRAGDWSTGDPGDALLRPAPSYRLVATSSPVREGLLYGYDPASARVLAFEKASGQFREQYRLVGGDPAWNDVRGMVVILGKEGDPSLLWWVDRNRLMTAVLEPVAADVGASPSAEASGAPAKTASPAAGGSPAPGGSPAAGASPADAGSSGTAP
jgi:hypothetical protein